MLVQAGLFLVFSVVIPLVAFLWVVTWPKIAAREIYDNIFDSLEGEAIYLGLTHEEVWQRVSDIKGWRIWRAKLHRGTLSSLIMLDKEGSIFRYRGADGKMRASTEQRRQPS